MSDERRQEERARADRRAVLIMKSNIVTPVQVTDVSPNGVGVYSDIVPELSVGEVAKLKIRGHTVDGEVMRLQPTENGIHIGLRLSSADGMLLA